MMINMMKKSLIVLTGLLSVIYIVPAQRLEYEVDLSQQLFRAGLLRENMPLKLHLGCGVQYLKDYINIDYPLDQHTVQSVSVADVFGDLTQIACLPNTVDEVRLHHVFEHFDRSTALALLCSWHVWLKPDGLLVIEVPDFLTSVKMICDDRYSYLQKQVILRHVFGSHEAPWAIHCDGWYEEKFRHILNLLGYEIAAIEYSSWKLTHNITIKAYKVKSLSFDELLKQARRILSESIVDRGEHKMLDVWYQQFEKKFGKMIVLE